MLKPLQHLPWQLVVHKQGCHQKGLGRDALTNGFLSLSPAEQAKQLGAAEALQAAETEAADQEIAALYVKVPSTLFLLNHFPSIHMQLCQTTKLVDADVRQ